MSTSAASIVFYHEALDGKYVPRVALFDLEPVVIGAVISSRRERSASLPTVASRLLDNYPRSRAVCKTSRAQQKAGLSGGSPHLPSASSPAVASRL
jgi:hypothetical protein